MVTGDPHYIRATVPIWYANTGMEIDTRFMLHVLPNKKPDTTQLSAEVNREGPTRLVLVIAVRSMFKASSSM